MKALMQGHLEQGAHRRTLNVRLDKELLEAIERAAEAEQRTRADLIYRALLQNLKEKGFLR